MILITDKIQESRFAYTSSCYKSYPHKIEKVWLSISTALGTLSVAPSIYHTTVSNAVALSIIVSVQ